MLQWTETAVTNNIFWGRSDWTRSGLARKVRKKTSFNPKLFLATVDGGRSVANYRKNEIVFSQGDPADAVFYVREGKIKLAVKSKRGKQASCTRRLLKKASPPTKRASGRSRTNVAKAALISPLVPA
ncbi:MAG: cyclic nucleotide-binding domain-containing protein, partial [Alphaproteobacteria bacterium]